MRKALLLSILSIFPILLCGCTAPKMVNSVWCAIESVQNGTQEGLGITSMYLYDDGRIDIYKSVVSDTCLAVAPYQFAKGTYSLKGKLKKATDISISVTTLKNQQYDCTGLIDLNKRTMLLIDSDSIANVYTKYSNFKVE